MYITYLLLAAIILVSVYAFSNETLKRRLMFNAYDVVHHRKWYRSFTHAFIHADWMHLFFNVYVLYVFGVGERLGGIEPELVRIYGPQGYMYYGSLYLGGILFSTIWSLYKHKDNMHYNALGASGAISAVVFAYIIINPSAKLGIIFIPGVSIPAYLFGPGMILLEYYLAKRGRTNIGHDAHISGAIFGIVFMGILDYQYLLEFFSKFVS